MLQREKGLLEAFVYLILNPLKLPKRSSRVTLGQVRLIRFLKSLRLILIQPAHVRRFDFCSSYLPFLLACDRRVEFEFCLFTLLLSIWPLDAYLLTHCVSAIAECSFCDCCWRGALAYLIFFSDASGGLTHPILLCPCR